MLNRRELIIAVARSSVLLSGAFALASCSDTDTTPVAAAPPKPGSLAEYTHEMQAISFVGIACREQIGYNKDQTPEAIQADLEQRLVADLIDPDREETIAEAVDRAVRDDFTAGRIIEVDGWQLSVTECRLAALAAAHQGFKSAQTPELPEIRDAQIVEIKGWGPKSTKQGQPFNEQPDGHSGFWFQALGAPASVVIQFDGKTQGTVIFAEVVTSGLRDDYMHEVINTPGVYKVELFDKAALTRQLIGEFTVHPSGDQPWQTPMEEPANCIIETWGPAKSTAGKPFNPQPGGASAFWVRSNCAVQGNQLHLDGVPLKTTVKKGLMTATVPNGHQLPAGLHELVLRVGSGNQSVAVGTLVIEP